MGPDDLMKYKVIAMVLTQIIIAYMISDANWSSLIILAYCLGGSINHSMTLAIHEISHNLAFGHSRPLANRILGMIANLPLGVPMSVSFKKYHLIHHRFQGDEHRDVDIPTQMEGKIFCNTLLKLVWVILQPFMYSLRPLFILPMPVLSLEIANLIVQVLFDILIYYSFGGKALAYLVIGSFLGTGLHPMSGHFISEHYMFVKGQETYSYYGPINKLVFNVGYHNEHHDFPSVPGCRLPMVNINIKILEFTNKHCCLKYNAMLKMVTVWKEHVDKKGYKFVWYLQVKRLHCVFEISMLYA